MSNLADAVLQMILENYSNPQFNANWLAEKMGKSTSFLREVVYTAYGMGIHELIETIRLEQAIKLLSANGDLIDLARVKAGYTYSKTFRAAFKKRLKLTPLECKHMLVQAEDKQAQVEHFVKQLWSSLGA
ncbi:MAG: helix-turn-helix domain-containing protein [bacterium]